MVEVPDGRIDPFVYSGFFVDLKHHLATYDHTYYGSRLPWLLFGNAAHSLADPLAANFLMRSTLLALGGLTFFITVRLLFQSAFVAAASSMLLIAHARFLGAIGWNYPDGAGMVLILVSFASLTTAAMTRYRRRALLLAGAAMATMVGIQAVLLIAIPAQLLWLFLLERQGPRRGLASLPWLLLGALGATAAFGVVNWSLGGPILYFMAQAHTSLSLDGSRWIRSPSSWLFTGWNVLPLLAGLLSVAVLALVIDRSARHRVLSAVETKAACCAAVMLAYIALFLALQLTRLPVLQWSYYSSYLIPPAFLVFASVIGVTGARFTRNSQILALVLVAALMLVPLSGVSGLSECAMPCRLTTQTSLAAVAIFLGFAAALVWGRVAPVAVALLAIGAINVGIADPTAISIPPRPANGADLTMAFETAEALRPFNHRNQLVFWYDSESDSGPIFRSISAMFMYQFQLIGEHFPQFTDAETQGYGERLYPSRMVAILTTGEDEIDQARTSLDGLNLDLQPVLEMKVDGGSLPFNVIVATIGVKGFTPVGAADLGQLRAWAGKVRREPDGASIVELNRQPWAYGAELPLPADIVRDYANRPATITIQLEVIRGTVGVGILDTAKTAFLARQSLDYSSKVELVVPRLGDASNLIVQNWDRDTGGRVRVRSVAISVKDSGE